MKAYLQNNVVVGIYTTDAVVPAALETVELSGRNDIPQLYWTYDPKLDLFSPPTPKSDVPLSEIVNAALLVVNSEANAVRKSYIGDMESQLTIYLSKFQDAKAFKAKVFGNKVEDYLWVAAEVAATGDSAEVAADRFITLYSALTSAFGKAEEIRIFARKEIQAATKIEDVRSVKMLAVSELRKLVKQ